MKRRAAEARDRIITAAPAVALALLAACLILIRPGAEPPAPSVTTIQIDLNAASESELRLLPNIGPALAARIVIDRESNGPFRRLEDLTRVRGIGERTLLELAPFATVSDETIAPGLDSTPQH